MNNTAHAGTCVAVKTPRGTEIVSEDWLDEPTVIIPRKRLEAMCRQLREQRRNSQNLAMWVMERPTTKLQIVPR